MLTDSIWPGPAIPATNSQASSSNIRTFSSTDGLDMILIEQVGCRMCRFRSWLASLTASLQDSDEASHRLYQGRPVPDFSALYRLSQENNMIKCLEGYHGLEL